MREGHLAPDDVVAMLVAQIDDWLDPSRTVPERASRDLLHRVRVELLATQVQSNESKRLEAFDSALKHLDSIKGVAPFQSLYDVLERERPKLVAALSAASADQDSAAMTVSTVVPGQFPELEKHELPPQL
jgi:hypothetical protein